MSLTIHTLSPAFAAEVTGFQAAAATDADVAQIKATMREHVVLVLRDQRLMEEEQVAFASRFGPLDTNPYAQGYNRGMREDLLRVSNVGDDQEQLDPLDRRRLLDLGNKLWHTDSSFKALTAHLSMLYGIRVAQKGGETQFADMRAAYDRLSDDWKRLIADLVAVHSAVHSRQMLGFRDWRPDQQALHEQVGHEVVRVLPESGRKSLYLSSHASHIAGMPEPIGRMLLHELTELATQADNVYTHKWRLNDLVIWDNRCTLHRLRRYDAAGDARSLRRVTTVDPTFQARDIASVTVPEWVVNAAA